jgi:hypothetical protein
MLPAPRVTCALAAISLLAPRDATAQQSWTVAEAPTWSVGGEPSGPTSDLFEVRGVVRLEDGQVLIADGGARIMVSRECVVRTVPLRCPPRKRDRPSSIHAIRDRG